MLILLFSIMLGVYGLMIVAVNLHRPHHAIAVAVLLVLTTIWVLHSGSPGLANSVKILLLYGCFVTASARPKQALLATGIVVCFNAAMEISTFQLTKTSSLPTIGILLMSCALYRRYRIWAIALMLLGLTFALLNFTVVQYRTEAVLALLIGFCFLAFSMKWRMIGSAILFLPLATSAIYFLIGSQFAISPDVASIYTFSIEGTASNFERSVFSFAILASLIDYPLGQPMQEATYGLRDLASAVERSFYEASLLDPHNFFLFFSMNFGFFGSLVFIICIWRTFIYVVYADVSGSVFIEALLLSIAAVTLSFFPFSTEPRTIAAVCIGATLRMSSLNSFPVYRIQKSTRHTYS